MKLRISTLLGVSKLPTWKILSFSIYTQERETKGFYFFETKESTIARIKFDLVEICFYVYIILNIYMRLINNRHRTVTLPKYGHSALDIL